MQVAGMGCEQAPEGRRDSAVSVCHYASLSALLLLPLRCDSHTLLVAAPHALEYDPPCCAVAVMHCSRTHTHVCMQEVSAAAAALSSDDEAASAGRADGRPTLRDIHGAGGLSFRAQGSGGLDGAEGLTQWDWQVGRE